MLAKDSLHGRDRRGEPRGRRRARLGPPDRLEQRRLGSGAREPERRAGRRDRDDDLGRPGQAAEEDDGLLVEDVPVPAEGLRLERHRGPRHGHEHPADAVTFPEAKAYGITFSGRVKRSGVWKPFKVSYAIRTLAPEGA